MKKAGAAGEAAPADDREDNNGRKDVVWQMLGLGLPSDKSHSAVASVCEPSHDKTGFPRNP
jgi:hypothetical protein